MPVQIIGLIASLIEMGFTVYSAVDQIGTLEEQADIQKELLLKRYQLEEELAQAQERILLIQGDGLEERQGIELDIAKEEAESIKNQLRKLDEIESMKHELEVLQLERTLDYHEFIGENIKLVSDPASNQIELIEIQKEKEEEKQLIEKEENQSDIVKNIVLGGIGGLILVRIFDGF